MSGYSLPQLNELISLAKQLGFEDDVKHWEAEKKKLLEQGDNSKA